MGANINKKGAHLTGAPLNLITVHLINNNYEVFGI